jgi:septum formation protein
MSIHIILASGSETRRDLLARAGVSFDTKVPRIDEQMMKDSLLSEGITPRDIADYLAEAKARKVSDQNPGALVIGCDQVLNFKNTVVSKPETPEACIEQLRSLRGNTHQLLSAAVLYEDGKPVWRHVGVVRLLMRDLSDQFIHGYVDRNWSSIQHSVGGYKLEEEGVRLFTSVQGDFFHVLGLPLLEILSYLVLRGDLDT